MATVVQVVAFYPRLAFSSAFELIHDLIYRRSLRKLRENDVGIA